MKVRGKVDRDIKLLKTAGFEEVDSRSDVVVLQKGDLRVGIDEDITIPAPRLYISVPRKYAGVLEDEDGYISIRTNGRARFDMGVSGEETIKW